MELLADKVTNVEKVVSVTKGSDERDGRHAEGKPVCREDFEKLSDFVQTLQKVGLTFTLSLGVVMTHACTPGYACIFMYSCTHAYSCMPAHVHRLKLRSFSIPEKL